MEYIIKFDNGINKLLGHQKFNNKKRYKLSKFIIKSNVDKGQVLWHSLTGHMLFLNEEECKELEKEIFDINLADELVQCRFLIPVETDEYKEYLQIKEISRFFPSEKYIDNYTILTTTDCNARCYYCYEKCIKKYHMSLDTAIDVAEFIKSNHHGKTVHLRWFGGEPLYNYAVIDAITNKLKEEQVKFNSNMVSNALLFNEATIEKAVNLWNLKKVQITLDGTADVYNKTKAYIDKTIENPFEVVINNIKNLIKNKIFVSVRVNVGRKNIDDIIDLIEYISDNIGRNKYMTIYSALLYGLVDELHENTNENKIFKEKLIILDRKIFDLKFNLFFIENEKSKLNNCMADNDHAVVVEPNGNLQKCEHLSNKEIIGNIYEGVKNIECINSWKIHDFPKNCQDCCLITQCNMLKKCSNHIVKCDDFYREWLINKQRQKIQNTYNKFRTTNL